MSDEIWQAERQVCPGCLESGTRWDQSPTGSGVACDACGIVLDTEPDRAEWFITPDGQFHETRGDAEAWMDPDRTIERSAVESGTVELLASVDINADLQQPNRRA